jgi:hypothetical protein
MRLAAGVVVLACVATAGWGLGRVGGQGSPPPAEKPSGDAKPSVEAARRAIRESYEARIRSAWECLPKDATPLDRLNALRPLWEEERQWHFFFEGGLWSDVLRPKKNQQMHELLVTHGATCASLDAMFADGIRNHDFVNEHHLQRVEQDMVKLHMVRREYARELLVNAARTRLPDDRGLSEIWPVEK